MKDYRYQKLDPKSSENSKTDKFRLTKVNVLSVVTILQFIIILLLYFNAPAKEVEVSVERVTETIPRIDCEVESSGNGMPSIDYELLRRRVSTVINDMWNFVRSATKMSNQTV